MALAALTQCGTRWRVLLASFRERFGKLIADHPNAKKEVDLMQASIVQNSPKANGNAAKWKQLADRAEANRRSLAAAATYRE
jgi:hypothetical protein